MSKWLFTKDTCKENVPPGEQLEVDVDTQLDQDEYSNVDVLLADALDTLQELLDLLECLERKLCKTLGSSGTYEQTSST